MLGGVSDQKSDEENTCIKGGDVHNNGEGDKEAIHVKRVT